MTPVVQMPVAEVREGPWPLRRAEWLLLLLAAATVALCLTLGMNRSLWLDEANSARWAKLGFSGIVGALRHDNNLPGYYFLLAVWVRLFGDSEPALRSLSAVFYLAAAAVTSLLAAILWRERRAGLYAGLLYLASSQAVGQAQTARMYSLLGLLAALSLLFYARLFVRGSRRASDTAAYLAVNAIGALTHVWFFFPLLGELLCQFLRLRRDRLRLCVLLAVPALCFCVLWGPVFLVQLRNGSTAWLPPLQPGFVLDALLRFYGVNFAGILSLGLCAAPAALAVGAARAAFRRDEAAPVTITLFAVCFLTPFAVSIFKPIYYPGRYTAVALPALAVLLGALLARFAPRPFASAVCSGVLIAACAHHIGNRNLSGDDPQPGQSDRATAEYIVRHAAPGDAIVFTSLTRPAADYYLFRFGASTRFVETSFPAELESHPGYPEDAAAWRNSPKLAAEADRIAGLARDGRRIWLYYGYDLAVAGRLKERLDRTLSLVAEHDLAGPFHRRLLVYTKLPDGSPLAREPRRTDRSLTVSARRAVAKPGPASAPRRGEP